MSLKSDLARVRGLGSAKDGTGLWWWQRVTGVALIPLSLWFVTALLSMVGAPREAVVEWFQAPYVAVLMIAMIIGLFYHLKLGMQTVFEDYIHQEWLKVFTLIALNFVVILCALVAVVAVLQLSLTN